jgi:hypothetical protein
VFRTVQGVIAASAADQVTAPSTALDAAYVVSITPAASVPQARPSRSVAAGSLPTWLVQTDGRGIERARMLVTSSAPVYLAKSTGARWYLLTASAVAGLDLAYDVTMGDDAGDWLEYASAGAPARLETVLSVGAGVNFTTTPTLLDLARPSWARNLSSTYSWWNDGSGSACSARLYALDALGACAVNPTAAPDHGLTLSSNIGLAGATVVGQPYEYPFIVMGPGSTGASTIAMNPLVAANYLPAGGVRLRLTNGNTNAGGLVIRATWTP